MALRQRNVKLGPKFKLEAGEIDAARSRIRNGHTIAEVAKILGVHRTTLARALRDTDPHAKPAADE